MKSLTCLVVLLSLFLIGFSGCSKEKRVSRFLYSKTGKWDNTVYTYSYYSNGIVVNTVTYSNAGYIRFEKNGSYYQYFSANGEYIPSFGKWSISDNDLSITPHDGATVVWKILDGSKKRMKLQYQRIEGNEKWEYILIFEKAK